MLMDISNYGQINRFNSDSIISCNELSESVRTNMMVKFQKDLHTQPLHGRRLWSNMFRKTQYSFSGVQSIFVT